MDVPADAEAVEYYDFEKIDELGARNVSSLYLLAKEIADETEKGTAGAWNDCFDLLAKENASEAETGVGINESLLDCVYLLTKELADETDRVANMAFAVEGVALTAVACFGIIGNGASFLALAKAHLGSFGRLLRSDRYIVYVRCTQKDKHLIPALQGFGRLRWPLPRDGLVELWPPQDMAVVLQGSLPDLHALRIRPHAHFRVGYMFWSIL